MSTENYGSIKILSHARNVPEKSTTFCWNIFDDPRADLIMFDHFYFTQFFITRPIILKKLKTQGRNMEQNMNNIIYFTKTYSPIASQNYSVIRAK